MTALGADEDESSADTCTTMLIRFNERIERRLPPIVGIVLKLAAHEAIESILAIQLGARIAPLENGTTIVFDDGIGHRLDFPSELWLEAERVLSGIRITLLEEGATYPPSGPFFYNESGEPIGARDIFFAIARALES